MARTRGCAPAVASCRSRAPSAAPACSACGRKTCRSPPPARGLSARVDLVEHLGDLVIVYATLAGSGEPLAIKQLPGQAPPTMGATVGLRPDPARLHLFDGDGRCLH